MASNVVQCLLAMLVILHPSAPLFTSSAHLPSSNPLDNPRSDDQVQQQQENSNSGEESNIILLNNINKKIWDASSLAPGLFYSSPRLSDFVTLDRQSPPLSAYIHRRRYCGYY